MQNTKKEEIKMYTLFTDTDTDIIISKNIGDYRVVFFRGKTDSSGIISDIEFFNNAIVSFF